MEVIAKELARSFARIFSGLQSAHGTYDLRRAIRDDGGKLASEKCAITKRSPVTDELWEAHLAGKDPGIGIIPIRQTNDAVFGAIDVDIYQGLSHQALASKLTRFEIPMIVCRTKSGGAHLYLFSRDPIPAVVFRAKLSEIATLMGFGDCEIFPKQNALDADGVGNWINVPYFGGMRGMRYAVNVDGNALTPEQFVQRADEWAVESDFFDKKIIVADEFSDGPPCLQGLCQSGFPPGTRNNGLYAIGVYLKQKNPDGWKDELDIFNHRYMQPPLLLSEVQGAIKSLSKKDYKYKCSDQPLVSHCNSGLCRTRKFGVGSGNGTTGRFPTLGGLIKLDTEPPVWFWTIEGKKVRLTTEELQNPVEFQRACMNSINMMPAIPSRPVWATAVQRALETVTVIEAPPDASDEGQFWEHVESFCTGRAQALSPKEIVLGKPCTQNGRTYFRMSDLIAYLNRKKFTKFTAPKIASMFQEVGAKHHASNFNGRTVNYWSLAEFTKSADLLDVPPEVGESTDAF